MRSRAAERRAAKARPVGSLLVLLDEVPHLIDGADAVQVTLVLRRPPREQAMTAKNDPVAARVLVNGALQHQRQLEAGALPGPPGDPAAELLVEFPEVLRAVGAGRERD